MLPDPKFVKRPDFFSENDQIGDQKEHKFKNKTAGQLGARFNACYFGQLTENTKKMKADQKTYACTSMNEEKSKKSKVILWTASKSVARSQKEKEEINERHKMWQKRQRAGTEKTTTQRNRTILYYVYTISICLLRLLESY